MYKRKSSVRRRLGATILLPAMALGCVVINSPAVAGVLDETAEGKLLPFSQSKVSEKLSIPEIKFPDPGNEETLEEVILTSNVEEDKSVIAEDGLESEVSREINDKGQQENQLAYVEDKNEASAVADGEAKKEIFVAVEKIAAFPGGEEAMMNWLASNIRYPEEAFKANIQGRVIVKFVINADGKIGDDVTVLRGVSPELDAESVRVVKSMPTWIPAENGGEKVACYYTLPISFKLTGNDKKEDNEAD